MLTLIDHLQASGLSCETVMEHLGQELSVPSSPSSLSSTSESAGSADPSLDSSLSSLDGTVDDSVADEVIRRVIYTYDQLRELPDLKPCTTTNHLFNELVNTCLQPLCNEDTQIILDSDRISKIAPDLRRICSEGEGELERFWATEITRHTSNCHLRGYTQALEAFPYFTNYIAITKHEARLIRSALRPGTTLQALTFIGSGPLPLTSILLSRDHFPEAEITNIDCDAQALCTSMHLIKRLQQDDKIQHLDRRAQDVPADILRRSDVVYLAALVGLSASAKADILAQVAAKMKEGAIVVARSAWGLRSLLYPVLDTDARVLRRCGLELVQEWRPTDDEVVNSVVILRVISHS